MIIDASGRLYLRWAISIVCKWYRFSSDFWKSATHVGKVRGFHSSIGTTGAEISLFFIQQLKNETHDGYGRLAASPINS